MTDPVRTRTIAPVLGGVVAMLAAVAVIVVMMSRSDGNTTDLGATIPTGTTSPSPGATESTTAAEPADYRPGAKDAVGDGLPAFVPDPLPDGWTMTEAAYDATTRVWHLAAVTARGETVGLWQSEAEISALVSEHAPGAVPGEDLDLSRFQTGVWSTWSADGLEALAQDFGSTSVVIVGVANPDVAQIAKRLLTFENDSPDVGD